MQCLGCAAWQQPLSSAEHSACHTCGAPLAANEWARGQDDQGLTPPCLGRRRAGCPPLLWDCCDDGAEARPVQKPACGRYAAYITCMQVSFVSQLPSLAASVGILTYPLRLAVSHTWVSFLFFFWLYGLMSNVHVLSSVELGWLVLGAWPEVLLPPVVANSNVTTLACRLAPFFACLLDTR